MSCGSGASTCNLHVYRQFACMFCSARNARMHECSWCWRSLCAAEKCQRGLLEICLAVVPRDTAPEDPAEDDLGLPTCEEKLNTTFPPNTADHILSGAGNRFTGVLPVALPVDGDACMVFDPTCSDAVISDSMATGVPQQSSHVYFRGLTCFSLSRLPSASELAQVLFRFVLSCSSQPVHAK